MRRRLFLALLAGATASSLRVRAQQGERVARIGLLSSIAESDPEAQAMITALDRGLRELGWVEGRNLRVERRWGVGDRQRIEQLARDLIALNPDVIVGYTTPSVAALRKETDTIPIVFVQVSDPIGTGFIADLAHPGGNVTGFTTFEASMVSKWAELIKEMAPKTTRIGYLFNPDTAPYVARYYETPLERSARAFGMEPVSIAVHSLAEIERGITALGRESDGALILLPDSFNILHRARIVALAAENRIPFISPYRFAVIDGGLMSYGIDQVELFRRAAGYVDRLLKGAKPADLPVQAPTKFELVINIKTATALGLDVPVKMLAAADEVIE
ncbi:MAG TPA: ABC transporter substrate-binding protein [Stellaceae bacterium]|nr:ABC transporter substrate-binding protein [Stellaceae bacterium]